MSSFAPDLNLDLELKRTIALTPEKVWAAWTTPELLMQWFTPAPWKTVGCDMDLRPGGRFNTVMESPEGERFPNNGCIVQVISNQLLVFTSTMSEDFRPVVPSNGADDLAFTARIIVEPAPNGATHYTAVALHADADSAQRHAEMGFHQGWGAALDQLVDLMSRES
jgi:uncharacterized protein YndB with AHSA1/START domain